MLVTSIFSFSHNVYKRLFFSWLLKVRIVWSRVKALFFISLVQVFRKYCEKRKHCSKRAISPFPTVFHTLFGDFSTVFINFKIAICKLFQFGRVVVWERVKLENINPGTYGKKLYVPKLFTKQHILHRAKFKAFADDKLNQS